MKKHLYLLLAFTIFSSSFLAAQINDSGNHGLMNITLKEKVLDGIEGSPYINSDFQSGNVYIEGKEPLVAYMRYDVHNENIEIKTDLNSAEIFVLPQGNNAKYEIEDEVYIYDKIRVDGKQIQGYFIEHFNGDQFRLLEKPIVTLTDPVKARTGYQKDKPAQIRIESKFYIQQEDGKTEAVRIRQKDIKQIFSSETANEYLKKNRIKSTEDLVSFLNHVDKENQ